MIMNDIAHGLLMLMIICLLGLWLYISWMLASGSRPTPQNPTARRHSFWPSFMAWFVVTFIASGLLLALLYLDGQLMGACR